MAKGLKNMRKDYQLLGYKIECLKMIEPTEEQLTEYEEQLRAEAKADSYNSYGSYEPIIKKMKWFLASHAESKNQKTNELYREHIPASVFGVASDEIASDMGISESELMGKLTSGLKASEPVIKRITRTFAGSNKKAVAGIDFDWIMPISGYRRTIRALGLITMGDQIVMLGRCYQFTTKRLENRVYGFKVDQWEAIRYLASLEGR